ncbi:GNAT family N-acetyltransferase [Xylophilus ampelinus]|uniref:RimJ/RimL family protein N-acetyltransferase n=1 Tax=Xylophilus ampelinus TaxID=54067 RepID=A0A318SKU3_9BURK|nr:GNAT family N-acetyltransferase [Xylophilus ampelinus]MCS4510407.1 GNAT family N-acetyltransferase [Xylophilus ampelinus]PYE77861.1 RimJ/RimL family protein N-acetyltransferase [Xylophilus ampelinus]
MSALLEREPAVQGAASASVSATVPVQVSLRPFSVADLDRVFAHLSDPVAVHMAGLTLPEPGDRPGFDAAWQRVFAMPDIWLRGVLANDSFAGHVACYRFQGALEVGYWIERAWWGQGVASSALRQLLAAVPHRPLHAHLLSDNVASLRVLRKCGFQCSGQLRVFAWGRREEVSVDVLTLD